MKNKMNKSEKPRGKKKGKKVSSSTETKTEDAEILRSLTDDLHKIDEPGPTDAEDPENGSASMDESSYSNFMLKMAAIEGAPRFIHHNEPTLAEVPFSHLLGKEGISMDDVLPKAASRAKAAKATKRVLLQLTGASKKSGGLRLPTSLSTPEGDRVAREAIYVRAKQDVAEWDAVVQSARAAETKSFPLKKPDLSLATAKTYSATFQARTPLEEQVLSLLQGSSSTVDENGGLSRREEAALAKMTLREAEEKRRQLTRLKVLQGHQEAKLKRQNKIKSKKYRRILRKQREKEKEKEMNELNQTRDPDDLQALESVDRNRILERATLRHRNNSKYLKTRAKMAKNTKEMGQTVQDQISKHRELTAKPDESASEEEEEGESAVGESSNVSKTIDDNYDNFNSDFKTFWTNIHESKVKKATQRDRSKSTGNREKKRTQDQKEAVSGDLDELFYEAERRAMKINSKSVTTKPKQVIVCQQDNSDEDVDVNDGCLPLRTDSVETEGEKPPAPSLPETVSKYVNPDAFVRTSKVTLPSLDDVELEDEEGDQMMALTEAFADDDVGVDFKSEKESLIEEQKQKNVDLTLPGWGLWGGTDIKISRRRRKRFTVKAPPVAKRLDENRGHLILAKEETLRKHQVNSVPFPFTSVADFEASVRIPVGDSFVPRSVFKKLIQPRVVTKSGLIIAPMDREELVKRYGK